MKEILPVAEACRRTPLRRAGSRASTPASSASPSALHVLAAIAGLAAPRLIGDLVQDVSEGTTVSHVDKVIIAIAVFLLAQSVLTRYARYVSFAFGEKVLAELREDFVKQSLALPIGTVERAGTGDLLTRTSRDVEALGWSVRFAVPETMIAFVTTIFTIVACFLVGAWVLVPLDPRRTACCSWRRVGTCKRAKPGYLRESASYAAINASVAETTEGARTVEALGLEQRRLERIDADIAESYAAERYTLYLRTVWFPSVEVGYLLPTVVTLAGRRLPAHSGAGRPRGRHGGDAVCAGADRPGRPADLVARRAAGRCDVAGSAARRGRRAGRPRGQSGREPAATRPSRPTTCGSPTSTTATSCTASTCTSTPR